MKYIPALDSIRAVAVLLVVASHWAPQVTRVLPFGEIGVDIFFVLSGFLISGILFDSKKAIEDTGVTVGSQIKTFITRRTLRIFPIYYLTILVHYLFFSSESKIRESVVYFVTYTSNFYFFSIESFDNGISPYWSLAVEEQFYLLWPLIVLLLPLRYMVTAIAGFILVGIAFPLFIENSFKWVLTPSCFNAFGLGALLAYIHAHKPEWVGYAGNYARWLSLFCVVVIIVYPFHIVEGLSLRLFTSILACSAIYYVLYRNTFEPLNLVLQNRVMIFIGKVSYGIYLYHTLIPITSRRYLFQSGLFLNSYLPEFMHKIVALLVNFTLLMLVCWLSWILIETPINGLKRYFTYSKAPARATG